MRIRCRCRVLAISLMRRRYPLFEDQVVERRGVRQGEFGFFLQSISSMAMGSWEFLVLQCIGMGFVRGWGVSGIERSNRIFVWC